jgi:leader peptidase (prepilin peptidase)/N-methyltransferase
MGIAGWAALVVAGPPLYASCLLGWVLLALAICDWRSFLLPDALTLPLLLAGLGVTAWLTPAAVFDHAAAAALGYALFRGIALGYRRLRGREGMGAGDAKLLAAGGAWLGLMPLPIVMLAAALSGLLFAAALALGGTRVRGETALPFGPALALGIWLVWLYGR